MIGIQPKGEGGSKPTVLYATRAGKVTGDALDLTSKLAKCLEYGEEVEQFLTAMRPGVEKNRPISLFDWFWYGQVNMLRDHKLEQAHQFDKGIVPVEHPVAILVGGKPKAPRDRLFVVDLLADCAPLWGQFTGQLEPESGLSISHPDKGIVEAAQRYRAGMLGGDEGYSVAGGRTLVLKLVASYKGTAKPPPPFACEVHASHRPAGNPPPIYLCADQEVYRLPYDTLMSIRIPVTSNNVLRLNGFGFSYPRTQFTAWPRGATLSVKVTPGRAR